MFINCSNHPSNFWSEEQKAAAERWGEDVRDFSFPVVLSGADEAEISVMADRIAGEIAAMKPEAVMCQGEFTLTFALVSRLKERGITVVSACSEREAREERQADGTMRKISNFRFVRFRKY